MRCFILFGGGMILIGILAIYSVHTGRALPIRQACQGTPWVIEEPLIKKTLTCVVELREKK